MTRNMVLIAAIAAAAAAAGCAREAPQKEPDRGSLTSMHEQMAKLHSQAADCIKAGRPAKECNTEAMKNNCPMMTGKADPKACPFMGDMKMPMHERMAELHSQAARCMADGRPVQECRNEAMKNCPMMTGEADAKMCPFMGGMMMQGMPMREHPKGDGG